MNNKFSLSLVKWLSQLFVLLLCFAAIPSHAIETITYYHTDSLGSPVAGTDTSGALLWKEDYKPYGERIRKQVESDKNTRWYTGHPEDKETGLTYAGARFYDSATGRFLAIDPVGFVVKNIQSFNRYTYANSNPYKYVDPDGKYIIAIGTSGEKKKINDALNKIKNSNPLTRLHYKELQDSKNNHIIRFPRPGDKRNASNSPNSQKNEVNGVGTGSETIVDLSKTYNVKDNGKRTLLSPESVLVHELLGHGLDTDRGQVDYSINPDTRTVRHEESAILRANIYRKSVSEQRRNGYR